MSPDESDETRDIRAAGGDGAPGSDNAGDDSADLLDSLLKAFDEREKRAAERAGAQLERGTSEQPLPAAPARPPDLARRPNEPVDTHGTIFTRSSTTASDIEALIKVATDSTTSQQSGIDVEPVDDIHMADPEFPAANLIVDETLFEALSDAAEGADDERAGVLDDLRIPTQSGPDHEGDAGAQAQPLTGSVGLPAAADPSGPEDWLTDLKPEQPLALQPEDLAEGDTDPDIVLPVGHAQETPATLDMDDVLSADFMSRESTETLGDLFTDEVAHADIAVGPVESNSAPSNVPDPADVSETSIIEEIGSENIAAGAADAALETAQPALAPPKKTATPSETLPSPPPDVRNRWLPPSPAEILRAHPHRAAVAIAVGLFAGFAVLALLAFNQYRSPNSILGDEAPVPLDRAIRLSASMVDQRDYGAAVRVLDEALLAASRSDPLYADARFQRLSAMMAALPPALTYTEANVLHSAIDEAVIEGRQHPRTAEALMWKAMVYEREDNPAAARAEYRGILDDYGNASNRDEVLIRLGLLELKFERPEDAIALARRVISDYPNSRFLNEARLLLGDASAAAGDAEAAREEYTRLAEDAMDSAVGAQAFERLGKMAIASGEAEAAIRGLETRLKSATTVEGNERVYLVLARAYRASKRPDDARKVLNELIDFFPESDVTPLALVELSQVLAELGLEAEATRFAERTVERYPDHAEVLVNSATLLGRAGKHADAGRTMLRAYDSGAKRPDVLISAGREFVLAETPRDAQAAFERAVLEFPSAPETVDAHVGWSRAAMDLGRVNDAFTRLIQISETTEGRPRQLPVLIALADLYGELGLQQDAIAVYTKMAAVTDDSDALAHAAQRLIEAGAVDEGLAIARGVDVAALVPSHAYSLLQAWGGAMLRADVDEAVELLQRAHDAYPSERTSAGVGMLMKAVLAQGRTAQARAILAEMKERTEREPQRQERAIFVSAAADYGDYLFARRDYAAAAEAYAMASALLESDESGEALSDLEYWNAYQRANALVALGRVEESLELYDLVAESGTSVARDARARGGAARLHQRRLEGPPPIPVGAGG